VPGVILAAISPDNTPHGYNWTFAFPMLLFIVIALILYALFSRPHRRIPGRRITAPAGAHVAASDAAAPGAAPGGATLTGSVHPQDLDSGQATEQSQEGRSQESTEASE
jgi:hypothetical protein